jgi:aminoglycoside 6'-N-acetyltransferase
MISLRQATLADLPLVERWDEDPVVAASGGAPEANDWNWAHELGRTVPWREFLIAERNGRPIGFIQIIDPQAEETHYWGDCPANLRALDIWIGEEDARGQGYGTAMMQAAIARCFADANVTAILIDPLADNLDAHRFYQRLGFRFVERRTFLGVDDCFVFQLTRADWRADLAGD